MPPKPEQAGEPLVAGWFGLREVSLARAHYASLFIGAANTEEQESFQMAIRWYSLDLLLGHA
ncbi:MAG TPA: hypothetical protein VH593_01780 [Ktedonobacteraceae bacterium]